MIGFSHGDEIEDKLRSAGNRIYKDAGIVGYKRSSTIKIYCKYYLLTDDLIKTISDASNYHNYKNLHYKALFQH